MIKLKFSILLFVGCILYPTFLVAQLKLIQFEQLDSLQKVERRTVVIFIHTDWCNYCQAMKSTTLKNKKIVDQLNTNFYFISFNAEEKRSIYFNGKTFTYKPTGFNTGTHQLAEQLATVNKKITYPTICFLNAKNEIIFQKTEYITSKELELYLK